MQRIDITSELIHRLSKKDGRTVSSRNQLREELEQQVADYQRNGGTINEIPTGLGSGKDAVVSDSPGEGFAICRPSRAQIEAQDYDRQVYLSTDEAAEFLGMSRSGFANKIRQQTLVRSKHGSTLRCAKKHKRTHLFLVRHLQAIKDLRG